MAQAAPYILAATAVAGTYIEMQAANAAADFEQKQAEAAAEVADDNAKQARQSGQVSAQEADLEAATILANVDARQGATGFTLSSPSFVRRQQRNRVNAKINRERTIEDSERQATSSTNEGQNLRLSAKNAAGERRYNRIAGALQIGTDLISGATAVNKDRAARLDRNRVSA
jgi:hypothetical protein